MRKMLTGLAALSLFFGCSDDTATLVDTQTEDTVEVDSQVPDDSTVATDTSEADTSVPLFCVGSDDCDAGEVCDSAQSICVADTAGMACIDVSQCRSDQRCVGGVCTSAPATCDVAECANGTARTCDGELFLACGDFGAACSEFVDTNGVAFSWCDCGEVNSVRCLSERDGIVCSEGVLGSPLSCPVGTECFVDANDDSVIGCVCDDESDGLCPDPVCTNDIDCDSCTPSCGGRTCGDNGCGGVCGECDLGQTCSAAGECAGCSPNCAGRVCGPDGCGGACGAGACPGSQRCTDAGQCVVECVADCAGKACGSDGCGGSCGSCGSSERCGSNNSCEQDCFFTVQTYAFDANGVDWSQTNYVSIRARQNRPDGQSGWDTVTITGSGPRTAELSFTGGCSPDVEIERRYSVAGGGQCAGGPETVMRNDITIPAPVISGGNCTAPDL